jgi:DNA polymerase-3 subunit gamma/tau
VHESVKAEHALLWAVLKEAVPVSLEQEELTLAFAPSASFLKRKAEDQANRTILADALQRLTGNRCRVAFELSDRVPEDGASNGGAVSEEELVARLLDELDAEELPPDWLEQRRERS